MGKNQASRRRRELANLRGCCSKVCVVQVHDHGQAQNDIEAITQ
jgi:hypothetical protein